MMNLLSAGMLASKPKTEGFNARSCLHPTGPEIARLKAERSPRIAAHAPVGEALKAHLPGVVRLGMAAKALHEAGHQTSRETPH